MREYDVKHKQESEMQKKIYEGHSMYQRLFLQDLLNTFGEEAFLSYLETNEEYLKTIRNLSSCLAARKSIRKKKLCEGIIGVSIGDTDFDADEFIRYECKSESIFEYALFRDIYDEHYERVKDTCRPWFYDGDFHSIEPPKSITELLHVCEYDDQGHSYGSFLSKVLYGELKVFFVKEKASGNIIEYYYVQDNHMICVHVCEDGKRVANQSLAKIYADKFYLLLLGEYDELSFREDTFLEV